MFVFWIIVALLALGVSAGIARAMLRGGAGAAAAEYDIAVYRDQLDEVERDLARGVITEETAERIRLEVSRRILDADRTRGASQARPAPALATWTLAGLIALTLVGGSLGLYWRLGAPGYGDLPLQARLEQSREMRESRPAQAAAESQAAALLPTAPAVDPQYVALVDRLRASLADRPDDLQGLMLLAQNEAALGNFQAAHEAQGRRLQVLGDQASGADWADYADLLILAAGGYVSPEAERALSEALARDPQNGAARYYSGLLFAQTDRPDLAFQIWRDLLQASTPQDLWVPAIRSQIEDAAARAGIRFELAPPEGRPLGPSQEQVEAAGDMTPEERRDMIRSMVDGLSDRLATEGGTPAEWARLIGALGVLGEIGQAQGIWEEGRTVFADNPDALAMMAEAAGRAGLTQ
jgi:cytochrome c-type biogenesis protein CcmH